MILVRDDISQILAFHHAAERLVVPPTPHPHPPSPTAHWCFRELYVSEVSLWQMSQLQVLQHLSLWFHAGAAEGS